jgi:tetratricopeptide (TPR) repeat protein
MGRARVGLGLILVVASGVYAQDEAAPLVDLEGLPQFVDSLLAEERFAEAVEACRKLLEARPDDSAVILPQLARALEATGQPAEAAETWARLAELLPGTGEAALALRSAADLAASSGDTEGAVTTYLQVLNELGADAESWQTFPGSQGYSQNRKALDLGARTRASLAALGQHCSAELAREAYRAAASEYPLRPAAKSAALGLARALADAPEVGQAAPWAVLVLDQGGDHDPVKAKLRLSANQYYLDAIAKPSDPGALSEALEILAACSGDEIAPETLAAAADTWVAAETAGLGRDHRASTMRFLRAARLGRGTIVDPCARIALSQWLRHLGHFAEAESVLPQRDAIANDAVVQWRDFQLGSLLASEGIYNEAEQAFARATAGPSPLLSDCAWLYRGECLEFQGLWDEAVGAYAELDRTASVPDYRRKARFWRHRVETLAAAYEPAMGTTAAYWGEDRQTQGQWDTYGEELFLLCGRMAPADLMGGLGAPIEYRVYTADPKKHYWWWNWHPVTDHPSVMPDPPDADATACNWDDGGEKQAIGTGPDLMVDLPVPEGLYRLSLYMVNDFNYYEPHREYAIYLLDQQARVLAACPVRDFEGGVYHHFVVEGPQELTIRIFRNLSLNTLLQAILLDRLDTRTGAMAEAEAYGPFGRLLDQQAPEAASGPRIEFCEAQSRKETVAALLAESPGTALSCWQVHRLLNAYGAGSGHEEQALARMRELVLQSLGNEGAAKFWSETADAQQRAGCRAGAVRFTRYAVELALKHQPSRERRLEALDAALERMQTRYPYYITASALAPRDPYRKPVDEAYSLELADRYIEEAFAGRTLMEAAADILPMARKHLDQNRRSIPKRFFEAVGMDNLAGGDLYRYSICCGDDEVEARALRGVLAAGVGGNMPSEGSLRLKLVGALAGAGDYDEAEAELQRLLEMDSSAEFTKANAAHNLAWRLMVAGHKDRARKWFEFVVQQYADTHFAELARKNLDRGLKLPWEEMKR